MRSNYRKIGPYIREVVEKNTDLSVELLLGVSVTKEFIPSIANIIGTDMTTYKIVRKNQFAYGPVTSRNSDKVSIALLGEEECIVSTSYTVFEITDENVLLPEYLMMWFRRPEFDRYARFKSHGSVRELFDWEEMCDVELPMPSIEKQREIVKEYHTIVNRMKLNERLNQKLEETAQAIYKQWFVDFEFPISAEYAAAIGNPELKGQQYKSSGGEMVFNELLKQEIPKGWDNGTIQDIGSVVGGATPSTEVTDYWANEGISWISPKDLSRNGYKFIERGEKCLTEKGFKASSSVMLPQGSVLFSSRAPIGLIAINVRAVCTNQGFKSVIPKSEYGTAYVYYYLRNDTANICNQGSGSTFDEVSGKVLKEHVCIIPRFKECSEFSELCGGIFQLQANHEKEHKLNSQLLTLLHSRMAKGSK